MSLRATVLAPMLVRAALVALGLTAALTPFEAVRAAEGPSEEILDLFKHEKPTKHEAPNARAPDPAAQLAEVRRKLAELERPGMAAEGSPPGVLAVEIGDRIRLLHQLERSLSQEIDEKAREPALEQARKDAEARADAWNGFADAPPYPLPFVDGLEASRDAVRARIAAIRAREALLENLSSHLEERLRNAEAGLRQAEESADHASGGDEARRARWALDLARLRATEASASLDQTRQALANSGSERKAAEADLRLANAELRTAQGHVRFTQQDLDKVLSKLDARGRLLSGESDRALAAWRSAREAADAAAPAAADLARQRAENANIELEIARMREALVEYERKAWTTRYRLMRSPTRTGTTDAYANLVGSLASLQAWSDYQNQHLSETEGEIAALDAQIRDAAPPKAAELRTLRDVYAERAALQKQAAEAPKPLQTLLERWQAEAAQGGIARSWKVRIGEAWAVAKLAVARVWNFELFSVEDSFETDSGHRITAQRSITIGKTVGALLLIVAGYWLCVKLAHLAHWLAMRMLGRSHAQANIVRRWTLAFLVAVLVMASLLAVRIPLTVFAFLGGALAIGIGFGAQNLLKNLMSGIILLIEKPLRVGDYIEFGEVRGRVTNIGFRASVVRAEDGVHTLIPNSTFIESNVTNLTFTSPAMRLQLDVGVSYGTDPAKVREVLLAAALSDPAVLKAPEPLAFLDDFAADAQKFRLVYWIDASPPAHFADDLETAEIASGVRERIVTRLAEAGIGIPFPQRTVHVDTPLAIEIARHAPRTGAN